MLQIIAGSACPVFLTRIAGSERSLARAVLLAGVFLVDRIAPRGCGGRQGGRGSISLLAQEVSRGRRVWQEVHWLLKYGIAQKKREWGNNAKARDLCRESLLELEEGRFSLWPYTDDARYRWQIEIGKTLGRSELHLGDFMEAQRGSRAEYRTGEANLR